MKENDSNYTFTNFFADITYTFRPKPAEDFVPLYCSKCKRPVGVFHYHLYPNQEIIEAPKYRLKLPKDSSNYTANYSPDEVIPDGD